MIPVPRVTCGLVLAAWIPCAALTGASRAEAQASSSPPETVSAPRPLTFEEGVAIINAAREHQQRIHHKPDCSHLVQEVYGLAGFPYPYATSFDLYAGIESFVQVESPQPGDLIVWPGHVGIVIDPVQRSFYSSLGSGVGTDAYDSRYWLTRGPARFYRYVVLARTGSLLASTTQGAHQASGTPVQIVTVPVIEGQPESPSAATKATAKHSVAVAPATSISTRAGPARDIPPSIPIVTRRRQPSRDEVAEAISELSNAAGNVLDHNEISSLPQPVVIFDQLRVERVKIKGERGWAEVRIDSRVLIEGQKIELKQRREKRRWELRRSDSNWLVFTPLERIYAPRDLAVRIFAAQLVHLTATEVTLADPAGLRRQQARLARLLNALLEEK